MGQVKQGYDIHEALRILGAAPKKSRAERISVATGTVIGTAGVMVGISFLQAQLVVWGLSLFHVDSGIWGPFLLLAVLESLLLAARDKKS